MVGGEGIGEAVTGAMLARAVEPAAGEATQAPAEGAQCLNCGTPLTGPYCHGCGQAAHVHRSLLEFWHELVRNLFQFEGKIWRTLPMLAWRPGEVTRRYIEGQRVRFVSPMALFLFSVFLMFAVFNALGGPFDFEPPKVDPRTQTELRGARDKAAAELDRLRKERSALASRGASTVSIDKEIVKANIETQTLNSVASAAAGPGTSKIEIDGVGDGLVGQALTRARENPSLIAYKLQSNAYKFSWALIPISVPFVWLLFAFRRRYRLYDHTVFVTYSIAFISLFVVALSAASAIGLSEGFVLFALLGVPPLHMYRQLRDAYQLSRFSALWRTMMLLAFALVAGLIFFLMLLAIGLFG